VTQSLGDSFFFISQLRIALEEYRQNMNGVADALSRLPLRINHDTLAALVLTATEIPRAQIELLSDPIRLQALGQLLEADPYFGSVVSYLRDSVLPTD
jgi:hypothetical protein